jgi:prepilin-type N-terminal cleavage/methylation domain-containing protein
MDKFLILRNSVRNVKGLSLLEILIVIIILAVSLTSISYFFSTSQATTFGESGCDLGVERLRQ